MGEGRVAKLERDGSLSWRGMCGLVGVVWVAKLERVEWVS